MFPSAAIEGLRAVLPHGAGGAEGTRQSSEETRKPAGIWNESPPQVQEVCLPLNALPVSVRSHEDPDSMPDLLDLLNYAEQGDIDATKRFLEWSKGFESCGATLARVDPVVGRSALHKAAEHGRTEYVQVRLSGAALLWVAGRCCVAACRCSVLNAAEGFRVRA